MSRKPVDSLSAMETRQALWNAIRAFGKPFTSRELRYETRCSANQTGEYLLCLTAAGLVERDPAPGAQVGNGAPFPYIYQLVVDPGPVAPRVRRDGSAVTQGQGRLNMWRCMRVLGHFTPQELAIHASTNNHQVKQSEAVCYCQTLARAGYLRKTEGHYQTIRSAYSGPKAPMIQRVKQVFDPNLGRVIYTEGGPL